MKHHTPTLAASLSLALMASSISPIPAHAQSSTYAQLQQDVLIDADLWSQAPSILSADYGFDNIVGVEGGETEVRNAGGTWNSTACSNGAQPSRVALTSSSRPNDVAYAFGRPVYFQDAIPVVFSWPVLPSTLGPTDFLVTLSDGRRVTPQVASIFPNVEYNERNTAVLFGEFGNRLLPGNSGAIYPVRVDIVSDASPLRLLGAQGPVSAVGLSRASGHGYVNGPTLLAAKLSRMSAAGEGAPSAFSNRLPNDGIAHYGASARYRLRLLTNFGTSPDGVRSVLPGEFSRYFRLNATSASGANIVLSQPGVDYFIDGARIRILGLADLGPRQSVYDDCYVEDHDNQIDIVLDGDEAALRRLRSVEIPSASAGYRPLYNPGGAGNRPTSGVTYTAPSRPVSRTIVNALDAPATVTYSPN